MPRKTYHHGDLKNALIKAGIEILSKEGAAGLTLRKVASKAGVSHAAPYAHFADKQALIAAISTEGYRRLYERILAVTVQYADEPARQLVEAGWAYVEFALEEPDHFRITLSGVIEVEKEKEYPAFVEMSQKGFQAVVSITRACQAEGILKEGPTELVALNVWALVHGIASLVLEDQVPQSILDRMSVRELLVSALNQVTRKPLSL